MIRRPPRSTRTDTLFPYTTLFRSLLIALALFEQAIDVDAAWIAGHLDELWPAEQWGEDALAVHGRAARRHDLETAARFLALLDFRPERLGLGQERARDPQAGHRPQHQTNAEPVKTAPHSAT